MSIGLVYYIASLCVLIFTIALFLRGTRLLARIEEQKWRSQCENTARALVERQ